jgi:tetratricopeptide (TPR) repeat protein
MRRAWIALGLALLVVAAASVAAWQVGPSVVSAYYVERGGHLLDDSPGQARQALQRALRWKPDNAQAYRLLGRAYAAEGQWLLAAEAFSQAADAAPGNPAIRWEWASACDEAGQVLWPGAWLGGTTAAGRGTLEAASSAPCGTDLSSWKDRLVAQWHAAGVIADDWVAVGDESLAEGKPAVAVDAYQRALWLKPDQGTTWIKIGDAWEAAGQPDRATEAYTSALATDLLPEDEAKAHASQGALLAAEQAWNRAVEELSRAVDLDPNVAAYHTNLGWYLFRAGADVPEAIAHLEQAQALNPRDITPWLRLSNLYRQEGELNLAVVAAGEAIEIAPEAAWAWLTLALARRQQGHWGKAVAASEQAIALRDDVAVFHLELARNLESMGQLERARAEYEQVLALDPDEPEALRRLEKLNP